MKGGGMHTLPPEEWRFLSNLKISPKERDFLEKVWQSSRSNVRLRWLCKALPFATILLLVVAIFYRESESIPVLSGYTTLILMTIWNYFALSRFLEAKEYLTKNDYHDRLQLVERKVIQDFLGNFWRKILTTFLVWLFIGALTFVHGFILLFLLSVGSCVSIVVLEVLYSAQVRKNLRELAINK